MFIMWISGELYEAYHEGWRERHYEALQSVNSLKESNLHLAHYKKDGRLALLK